MGSQRNLIPLIVIVGPTSSGKSTLGIRLAQRFGGEIVSADSRQVYRFLDIGSGKVTKREQKMVRHHLLDICNPGARMTLAQYKRRADAAIVDIMRRGKAPFLVGGSALYIKSVVENYIIPPVKRNAALRKKLEMMQPDALLALLRKHDLTTFRSIDKKNRRRIIRALEVCVQTGVPFSRLRSKQPSAYRVLFLGISHPRSKLYARIDRRVDERVRRGMILEVERLMEKGVSKKWLESLGLEYRAISQFLLQSHPTGRDRKEAQKKMLEALKYAIHDFARRQLTWWWHDNRIHWIKTYREGQHAVRTFLASPGR